MNSFVDLMAATGLLVLLFAVILAPLGLIVKVAIRQYSGTGASPSTESRIDTGAAQATGRAA